MSFEPLQARLRYLPNDFQTLQAGSHVSCAVTGKLIRLDQLQYWSVARQEAYRDVHAALEAELKARRPKA